MGLESLVERGEKKEESEGGGLGSLLDKELNKKEEEEKEEGGLGGFLDKELSGVDTTRSVRKETQAYQPEIHFHSSENMEQLEDESVHLTVTSPPYNTGWEYGDYDDSRPYAAEYLQMLARVFREVYRVTVPGGRFLVNVPSLLRDGSDGGYPIAADICRMMTRKGGVWSMSAAKDGGWNTMDDINTLQEETNWVIREQIAWVKGFNDDGLAPNGSFPRPWGVLLNNMHEVVVVFQKPGSRSFDEMEEERIENSKINKTDDDMCDDVWFISPERWNPSYVDDENIPVFPEKLVRRSIQLWTYEKDTVLDPFAGRFTVGKVAREERRESVGYEIREDLKRDIKEYVKMGQSGLDSW